ncbi:unnamed protein product [Orchesella dallaii]|uniref:Zinc transporter 1 n=1 Tax=Orchesella dallaii TaxID=48710 RepID=A0ABP1PXD9_9HEXA
MFARKESQEEEPVTDARPYSPLMPSSTPPLVLPDSPRTSFLDRQKTRIMRPRSNSLKGSDKKKMGSSTGNKTRLIAMFAMTFGFFLVEIIVGYITNSMALVADSFHMLSDVAALVVAFVSVKMSPKKWSKNTFGWARAEVLGALVNAVFLVALCFSILVESVKRFLHPEDIDQPKLILIVGVIGLFVNLIGICLFRHHHGGPGHNHHHHSIKHQRRLTRMVATDDNENDERVTSADNAPPQPLPPPSGHAHSSASQMNMRGVFLHIMADALGSVIVIISALIIWLTEWEYKTYVDPCLSVFLVVLILYSVWPLLQESAMILLQTVPTHIQIDELQRKLIREVEGVIAVHEFHIWQLAGDRIIASAHIRCRNLADYIRIAEKVKEFFHNEGIHSTTIQPEFVEQYPDVDQLGVNDCYLSCSDPASATSCAANTCCGPISDSDAAETAQDETLTMNNIQV